MTWPSPVSGGGQSRPSSILVAASLVRAPERSPRCTDVSHTVEVVGTCLGLLRRPSMRYQLTEDVGGPVPTTCGGFCYWGVVLAGPPLDFGAEDGFTVKSALFPELERG
jgi:hypothetical protein